MKTKLFNSKMRLLVLGAILINSCVFAASYTAVTSGNWSSAATWGGTKAPFTLSALDQVTIGTGITVTMDSTVTLNGLLSQLSVTGTLTSTTDTLIVTSGTLTGAGSIMVDNLKLNSGGTFSFTGSVTANTFTNSIASLALTAKTTVNKVFNIMSIVSVQTGGSLTMGANSIVNVAGGSLAVSGGTLSLSSTYDVNYQTSSSSAGMELSGSGLRNVTVNVTSANSVTLGSSLVVADSLKMMSGTLVLNGNSLTLNGQLTGTGTFSGDASANLIINTSGGTSVPVKFAAGAQTLNNLTINVGSSKTVVMGSYITVGGTLALTSGDIDISNQSLTLNGSYSGTGSIMTNSHSMVTIGSTSSITNAISFAGTSMADFTLNVGSGNTVTLGSDLNVADTLSLTAGTLVLNGKNLSVMGNIAASGTGMIFSTSASNVSIATASSPAGSLSFTYPGNDINDFNINIGGAGSLMIASNVMVHGAMNFTAGKVDIGNYNMTIASTGSITGTNSNSYVVTSGTGYLTMNATTSGTVTLPVGTTSYYFPALITLNSGSSTGTVGVNVNTGVYTQGTSGTLMSTSNAMVNATWLFQTSITSGLKATMQLAWSPAAEVNGFVHTGDYISHYNSGNWDTTNASTAVSYTGGMFTLTRTNLTSFSPFAVFDQATLGVNVITANNQFEVYPVPATNFVYVKNNGAFKGLTNVDVLNILGQVVSSFTLNNSNNTEIPLDGLKPGDYFIKLYNSNGSVVKRIIKL